MGYAEGVTNKVPEQRPYIFLAGGVCGAYVY